MTEDLKKARSSNQSFWLMGQPDVEVRKRQDGRHEVEVHGFDYFDTAKGELVSGGKGRIAMWSLDTDYDGRSAQLLGGRFEVSVVGNNYALDPFVGRTVPLASNDSALFWFFQPANFELLVKIVDGCSLNNRFWVFYAATTNVEFTLTVVDTFADPGANTRTYHNPLGTNDATPGEGWPWIGLLALFAVVFGAGGTLAFGSLIDE